MSVFGRLRQGFAGAAALATATFAASPALAQDAKGPTQVAMLGHEAADTTAIHFLEDAHRPADRWVVDHPERVAVSVRLGTQTPENVIENIEPLLRQHFESNGISNLAFFWERGDAETTGLAYHTDDQVFGPYGLHNALDNVPVAAGQIRFNQQLALSN